MKVWPGSTPPEEGDAEHRGGTERNAPVPPRSVVAPTLVVAARNGADVGERHGTGSTVEAARNGMPSRTGGTPAAHDTAPATRRHTVDVMAALGDDAIEGDAAPGEEAPADPRALKVRGWAGRGPVGLTVIKPPKHIKARLERQRGGAWPLWWAISGAEIDG